MNHEYQHPLPLSPATARRTDPDTSHAAADSWSDDALTKVQQNVWEIHLDFPEGMTDEEMMLEYRRRFGAVSESSPRKRRCDLTRKGLIEDTGLRRRLISGRQGIVWKLVRPVGHHS